jgi:hypothetical protein
MGVVRRKLARMKMVRENSKGKGDEGEDGEGKGGKGEDGEDDVVRAKEEG